jgi:hypothetical protein
MTSTRGRHRPAPGSTPRTRLRPIQASDRVCQTPRGHASMFVRRGSRACKGRVWTSRSRHVHGRGGRSGSRRPSRGHRDQKDQDGSWLLEENVTGVYAHGRSPSAVLYIRVIIDEVIAGPASGAGVRPRERRVRWLCSSPVPVRCGHYATSAPVATYVRCAGHRHNTDKALVGPTPTQTSTSSPFSYIPKLPESFILLHNLNSFTRLYMGVDTSHRRYQKISGAPAAFRNLNRSSLELPS